MYTLALDRLQISLTKLFLDDFEPMVKGAQQVGIHAIHVSDHAEAIKEVQELRNPKPNTRPPCSNLHMKKGENGYKVPRYHTDLSERFPLYTRANVGNFPRPRPPLTSSTGLWQAELGWRDAWVSGPLTQANSHQTSSPSRCCSAATLMPHHSLFGVRA